MAHLKLTREQVLGRTRSVMEDAWIGYELLTKHHQADRQLFGLRTLVTSGRGTTFMAQKLRSVDSGFDDWYQPIAREMNEDELCRYFYTLRSTIEKEGLPHPITATLEFLDHGEVVSTASVNVMEDRFGVWVNGSVDNFTFNRGPINQTAIRGAQVQRLTSIRLPNPPRTHLGNEHTSDCIDYLGLHYLEYLFHRLVIPFVEKFGGEWVKST
jgi:hypothetical protein